MGAIAPPLFEVIFFFFFACVLVIEVGDVRRYPYPVSGKFTYYVLRWKKNVSESAPPFHGSYLIFFFFIQ